MRLQPLTSPTIPIPSMIHYANIHASSHGIQVQSINDTNATTYECAPISLLPNAYPRYAFELAISLAPSFNILVDRLSTDVKFITNGLKGVRRKDVYTDKLLSLYENIYSKKKEVYGKFAREADRLGILRSDYMLTKNNISNENCSSDFYELKQVELNTIASSFGGLSTNVANLHRDMIDRFGENEQVKKWLECNQSVIQCDKNHIVITIPHNKTLSSLARAMNLAHQRYLYRYHSEKNPVNQVAILFIVQEQETNTIDQALIELELWKKYRIAVVRMSLTHSKTQLHLDTNSGALYIIDPHSAYHTEISISYFRAGYDPSDYPSGLNGTEWNVRESIELSRSTKCPNLGYHLCGTKKIQQLLTRVSDTYLEQYLPLQDIKIMKNVFAQLYSLDIDDMRKDDRQAIYNVLHGGEKHYVLKPQREGGGHNVYGRRLVEAISPYIEYQPPNTEDLNSLSLGHELAEYILMERLFPPHQQAILVRQGRAEGGKASISELGCFGTIVSSADGDLLLNEFSGYLLRTKFDSVDEGGVAAGFATLSSPYLC